MERDVVCGVEIDKNTAAAQSEYQGRTFYFCSTACKEPFDKAPEQYAQKDVA